MQSLRIWRPGTPASDDAKLTINVLLQSGSLVEFLIAATALLPESEDEADLSLCIFDQFLADTIPRERFYNAIA